ncbi:MFS transporter [Gynurincola endophyticus]|jgi:MFS family permease|uniref:MFS transporter n=1 Tax=Gynurincola endophyticus TaxID=2479004 RepID=UPI000F8C5B0D|nr:MFS transporter [Gynurincola endophyticus]
MKTTATPHSSIWKIIGASSVGTLIEWYDFYIFGSLATVIADQFFPKTNPTAALLSTLATFAAGFIVRPFGALVFGRLGDLIGRKYTFLLTLVLMGGSTFAIGLIPGYESIGFLAPVLVLLLRLIQGLALGGEYGGAATYVAEHAPDHKRGFYTSWIQTTATLGLLLSLSVILITRQSLSPDPEISIQRFNEWGWRIPFWLSILLVVVSIYIRMKMHESPLFSKIKASGNLSKNPLKESFGKKDNLKMVLLALFGATMGQGVVWYTGQFYAQSFIETVCKIDFEQSRIILIWAIVAATPFFVIFGSWSDKVGRKWIMLIGMLLAVCTYRPIFNQFIQLSDVNNKTVIKEQALILKDTTFYENGQIMRQQTQIQSYTDGTTAKYVVEFVGEREPIATLKSKTLGTSSFVKMIVLLFLLVLYVTMVYGPIAAYLVEIFPTKIRYTSMSLPYHIGNGIFGGLTPFIALLTTTVYINDQLSGLWYPIIIAAICFVIGAIYMQNKFVEKD